MTLPVERDPDPSARDVQDERRDAISLKLFLEFLALKRRRLSSDRRTPKFILKSLDGIVEATEKSDA